MNDWRKDPATDAQKKRLMAEGIKFHPDITKGGASDLIGTTEEPDEYDITILKYFKIRDISKMSQTDARHKIDEIFADEKNIKRWNERSATKAQKDIYKFFNIPIPQNLRFADAEKFIAQLFEDEEKQDAWDNHDDKLVEREMWLEDTLETINEDRNLYNCKKIGKKLFQQIVESLESSGMTLEEIEKIEQMDLIFQKALEINPDLRKKSTTSQQHTSKKNEAGCSAVLVLLIFITFIIIIGI